MYDNNFDIDNLFTAEERLAAITRIAKTRTDWHFVAGNAPTLPEKLNLVASLLDSLIANFEQTLPVLVTGLNDPNARYQTALREAATILRSLNTTR